MMTLLAIDWFFILEKLILIALVVTLSMIVAMYALRKKGPPYTRQDRAQCAGPFGLLQPLVDGVSYFYIDYS